LLTIEIGEDMGNEVEEVVDKGIERVMLMNIYHMETFFKIDQDENNANSQMKIVVTS
jgi:hypothetical protein